MQMETFRLRARSRPPATSRGASGVTEIPADQPRTRMTALMSNHNAIPSCCLYRRSALVATQGWRKFGVIEDKDMVIQVALRADVDYLRLPLVEYRRHETNRSLTNFYEALDNLSRYWWAGDGLSADDRRLVRRALIFDRPRVQQARTSRGMEPPSSWTARGGNDCTPPRCKTSGRCSGALRTAVVGDGVIVESCPRGSSDSSCPKLPKRRSVVESTSGGAKLSSRAPVGVPGSSEAGARTGPTVILGPPNFAVRRIKPTQERISCAAHEVASKD